MKSAPEWVLMKGPKTVSYSRTALKWVERFGGMPAPTTPLSLHVHVLHVVNCCLATKISKAPIYLEAEVVEEVIGWLG